MDVHTERSVRAAGAGFLVLAGIAILLGIGQLIRYSRNGRPGVSLKDVARCYELTWSPRGACPAKDSAEPFGSPAYAIWWTTILLWLGCGAVYLIVIALVRTIHVYRETALVASAACVAGSLAVAGLWQVSFRMAGTRKETVERDVEATKKVRVALKDDGYDIDTEAPIMDTQRERRKKRWLWLSFCLLLLAWILALVAVGVLQPLTYPGNQYGVMILIGGGYGLYAGWLLYAMSLGVGIATSAESCPDGTTRRPPGVSSGYPASMLPVVFSVVLLVVAVVFVDPVQPLVWIVTLLIFVPKYNPNIYALVISFVALVGGGVRLYLLRWA